MDKTKRTAPTSNKTPEWIRISDERTAAIAAARERILQANKKSQQDMLRRTDEQNRIANKNSPFGKHRPLVRILGIGVALYTSIVLLGVYSANNSVFNFAPTSMPERTGAPNVGVTVFTGQASTEFYLDGTYSTSISITDDSDTCVLSMWARESGESLGTEVYNDIVSGNSGNFPGPYQQIFTWDSVVFYGEFVRFFNEGSCEKVQLSLSRE